MPFNIDLSQLDLFNTEVIVEVVVIVDTGSGNWLTVDDAVNDIADDDRTPLPGPGAANTKGSQEVPMILQHFQHLLLFL